jgi:transketolase
MSLRLIPNMQVLRPADARETVGAWSAALERKDGPTVLALTRQKLPVLEGSSAEAVARGGYVLRDSQDLPAVILMATGSEVALALDAADRLEAEGVQARVVSLPSLERFQAQTQAYRDSVLPPGIEARVAVEAGVSWGWERLVGSSGAIIGLDRFGASAPAETLFEKFGFTVDNIVSAARRVMET